MWVMLALSSAVFVAATDPISKKALNNGADENIIGWAMVLLSTPFLALFAFSRGVPHINAGLISSLAMAMPFEVAATVLYYKAIKLTDISLSVPFLALTPIFVCITGFLVLGEKVGPWGFVGILFITIGAYTINIKHAVYGVLHPIRAVFRNKGSLYMAAVALMFSMTAVLSKRAMLYSSPESIPFIYNLSISLSMLPVIIFRISRKRSTLKMTWQLFSTYLLLGLCVALSAIFFFKAVSMANVAYAVSIKRISLLMSVIYGWLFFKERDAHIRLASTACMIMGSALIVLSR